MRKITDRWLFTVDNDGYHIMVISDFDVSDFGHVTTGSLSSSLKGVIYRAESYYLHCCRDLLCDVRVVGFKGNYSLIGRVRFEEIGAHRGR